MEGKLKVLLLEDNPSDVEFAKRELKKAGFDFELKVVDTRDEYTDAIEKFVPGIILSDHSLPQFNSLEALHIARERIPWVPFLLVTGAVSEEFAVQVIKEGADDYILKGHLMRLPSAITNAMKKKVAERERETMLQQLLLTNNELNTFVYKATHDLRGPLTSIMGLTNLATREENQNTKTYVKMISECTQKLDEVLVSLIETMAIKNAKLSREEIDFNQLLEFIFRRLEFMPGFQRMTIEKRVSVGRKFVSDPKVLGSILQNLIENAIKYQDHSCDEPYIHVAIRNTDDELQIEISDNGIGIAPAIQEKVFDMFFRGNDGSKGSGLGLYLVKNGVQRLGGTIRLKSEPGAGTTMSIVIPVNVMATIEA